jgi:DNA-binding NarL/FixJ family response regulator
VRVAVAEDLFVFRDGLGMLLEAAGHEVVARAGDGDELIAALKTQGADVSILDIRMPPGAEGGLTTGAQLRTDYPDMALLFLSHYSELHYLMRILDIGAEGVGYRLKERIASVEALTDTLTRLGDGEVVIEPALAKRLVERPRAEDDQMASLSPREREVLRLMAEGRSNAGIAGQLIIGVKTVEKFIASIFDKLDLRSDESSQNRRVLAVLSYLRAQQGPQL